MRGISSKLQEEERERRTGYVREKSEVDTNYITVDHVECSSAGEDLHRDYQIVTKEKILDQTLQEGVPTNLRTHIADLNVCSPMWCPITYYGQQGC